MALIRPRLTDHYNVALAQEEADFAIPFLDEDIPLCVDPFLLWKSPSQQEHGLYVGVKPLPSTTWALTNNCKRTGRIDILMRASECDEVGLGFSGTRQGNRIGGSGDTGVRGSGGLWGPGTPYLIPGASSVGAEPRHRGYYYWLMGQDWWPLPRSHTSPTRQRVDSRARSLAGASGSYERSSPISAHEPLLYYQRSATEQEIQRKSGNVVSRLPARTYDRRDDASPSNEALYETPESIGFLALSRIIDYYFMAHGVEVGCLRSNCA